MPFYIYLHRNKINNKVYIGQTKNNNNPNRRWHNGEGYDYNDEFYSDIQLYGWDNGFEHIILEKDLSLEECNLKEQQYITYYKACDKNFGYNKDKGGGNYIKNSFNIVSLSPSILPEFISLYYNNNKSSILKQSKNKKVFDKDKIKYQNNYNKYYKKDE